MNRAARRRAKRDGGDGEVLGVAWFSAEQWAKLGEIAADADELQSYEEWKTNATSALETLVGMGRMVLKVDVEVDALVEWCQSKGRPVNAEARSEYVAFKLRKDSGE